MGLCVSYFLHFFLLSIHYALRSFFVCIFLCVYLICCFKLLHIQDVLLLYILSTTSIMDTYPDCFQFSSSTENTIIKILMHILLKSSEYSRCSVNIHWVLHVWRIYILKNDILSDKCVHPNSMLSVIFSLHAHMGVHIHVYMFHICSDRTIYYWLFLLFGFLYIWCFYSECATCKPIKEIIRALKQDGRPYVYMIAGKYKNNVWRIFMYSLKLELMNWSVYVHIFIYLYIITWICVCIYRYTCMYICLYIYMRVCTFAHIHLF